jgi:hypothetical protein
MVGWLVNNEMESSNDLSEDYLWGLRKTMKKL